MEKAKDLDQKIAENPEEATRVTKEDEVEESKVEIMFDADEIEISL